MSGIARKLMSAGGGDIGAWDLSYAYYDPPESSAWDVSTANSVGPAFDVSGQDTDPRCVFFKPDGLKMYVLGNTGDAVYEYDLSTAWDVSSASFLQSFSVATQETVPTGLFFKPDGLKMYVLGNTGDAVYEYDLSTAWDVSSASFLQSFSVATQETVPTGLFFKPDGLKMYIVGSSGDEVNEYDLSTAWDVSTASFLQLFDVSAQETVPEDLFFKPDGLKMYVLGSNGDDVNEYDLSTAWDVSTASFLQNFSVATEETIPTGIFFKPDGTQMYIVGRNGDDVNQYVLGGFGIQDQENLPEDIFFKPDGTKMYVIGSAGDDVNEYDLSTAWDISSASFLQLFDVSSQETTPTGLFFKPDGTKMYVIGSAGDDVNEYDLSSAWDVSTASYLQNFSVAAQEVSPEAIFFKPDGTKMYIIGGNGDDVNEYDLSTPWDVSSASFLQVFDASAQVTFPSGLFFKTDGTQMYVVDEASTSAGAMYQYTLSTAWDVSTASFLQDFDLGLQTRDPAGLFFKPDGTQMFIVSDFGLANVFAYTLGPQ